MDAATDGELGVVWLALDTLTAAIAMAEAAQATCLRMVHGSAHVATGGGIPVGSGVTRDRSR